MNLNYLTLTFYCFIITLCSNLIVEASENLILKNPSCSYIAKFCRDVPDDDLSVLECAFALNHMSSLNKECQNVIWDRTNFLIDNHNLKSALSEPCSKVNFNCKVDEHPGSYLNCFVKNKDQVVMMDCIKLIERYENVAFHDYQWISSFLMNCKNDVIKLQCGRFDGNNFSQRGTLKCLQDHIGQVAMDCRQEVFKLSEMQADNFNFDEELYSACIDDYHKYCPKYEAGNGKIFKCLMQHYNEKLTAACRKQLIHRQKLISQDYKISKGLMRACRDDIKSNRCRKDTSNDKEIRLAQILLCLESAIRNNTKVTSNCEIEMSEHRKMLMEDYRLTPEIVNGCAQEITKFCPHKEMGGKTIHCLMDHVRGKLHNEIIGSQCQRSLEYLVQEADVGEDWRVDPVLHEACSSVVRESCKDIRGGNARVMSCLMDNIGTDNMPEKCEDALMQIQYFVARDFKLDPQLYHECHEDAVLLCHASRNWYNISNNPDNGPLVLPCLYRYVSDVDNKNRLKPGCIDQIRRTMQQRAVNVDLQPEIEEACMDDLAFYCFDKTAKGEEILCLQKNLEDLHDKCREAITKFTEVEAQFIGLNPFVAKHCKREMKSHCSDESGRDGDDLMNCLITHKNEPDVKTNTKCRVSIEHFQIISLKDYRFSYKFKMACKNYAMRFCRDSKTKSAVVNCLSEKVLNDTIQGLKSGVQKDCRQQLKAQLFQQRENIDFDPKLNSSCYDDIKKYCGNVEHGYARVLECLQSTPDKLSLKCQKEIFKIKKEEIMDNSLDYALITMCSESIQRFCSHVEEEHVLDCLKTNKNQIGFTKKCRLVVMHRIIEQQSDYRLNPSLQEHCKIDINKFCHEIIKNAKPDQELNGEITKCLQVAFKKTKLSNKCEKEMASILKERALNVHLNPALIEKCRKELQVICKEDEIDDESGDTEECLKNALLNHKITNYDCRVAVADLMGESLADIQADPLLYRACGIDLLKFCNNIQQGGGRLIKCLKIIMADKSKRLESECEIMLSKRLDMYNNAAEIAPPEGLHDLYDQVIISPSKHYFFMMILLIFGSFFVIGIFCGRVSKKHAVSKNK